MAEHLKKNRVEVTHDLVSLRYVSLRKRFFLGGGGGVLRRGKSLKGISWFELRDHQNIHLKVACS